MVRWLKSFAKKATVIADYETGCMGYTLRRGISQAGIECRVISPKKIDRMTINRIKTDARDAVLIARMIKHNEYQTDQSSHNRSSSHCPAAGGLEKKKDSLSFILDGSHFISDLRDKMG